MSSFAFATSSSYCFSRRRTKYIINVNAVNNVTRYMLDRSDLSSLGSVFVSVVLVVMFILVYDIVTHSSIGFNFMVKIY